MMLLIYHVYTSERVFESEAKNGEGDDNKK